MKSSNKALTPIAITSATLAITLPLLMLGGCAGHESVKLSSDVGIKNNEVVEPIEVVDGSQLETGIVVDFVPEQEINAVAESETIEPIEETTVAEKPQTPVPTESLIGFAFDQSNISAEYGEMLWQHAQYLQENKNLILRISGHTDNSGARVYNEMLSLKRAQQVANILIDFGVPEDRIKVSGKASDQPLIGAVNQREHRRVELDFEDTQLVSN